MEEEVYSQGQAVQNYVIDQRRSISPSKEFPDEDHDYGQLQDSPDELDDEQEVEEDNEPSANPQLEIKQLQREEKTWQALENNTLNEIQKKVLVQQRNSKAAESNMKGYKVYKDYTCMLNFTNLAYGVMGNNKFYQIQVVHRGEESFGVYTKWGRVGVKNPQSNIQEVDSRFTAIKEFKKKFTSKTGNDWEQRDQFTPIPDKYTMINVIGGDQSASINEEVARLNKRNALLAQNIIRNPSRLEGHVKALMAFIWDIEHMQKTLKEQNIDTQKNPLGRLANEQITKGYKVLKEIQNHLRSDRCKESTIIDLSNLFYTNIPQSYGMKKPPIINTMTRLKEKIFLLDILREFDLANKYINIAASEKNTDINPLDLFYGLLKCELKPLTEPDTADLIRSSVFNTHGPTHTSFKMHVIDIFEVDRKLEHIRYYPCSLLPNRKLLWHGSRKSNYVGILSEGLKIAPPEAPSSGYMFGKGVYFADVCSKSAQYCWTSTETSEGLLLLCEVALGNMYQVFKAKDFTQPPHRFHSVHGVGRNQCDPAKQIKTANDVSFETGAVIPNEELRSRGLESDLIYNEYIVYDPAQVIIRYVVKVRFVRE